MTRARKAIIAGTLTVTSAASLSAIPILGPGLPVFDGTALVESMLHTTHMVSQVNQLIQTYQKIRQQYDHMIYQAKSIHNLYRYESPTMIWRGFSTSNAYGRTGKWIQAVNNGNDTYSGWVNATTQIMLYPGGFASIPAAQRARKEKDFGGLELQEGTALSALDTIGRARRNGLEVEKIVAVLERDILSKDPDLQTEAAQLNKGNAIALIHAKSASDQNKLLVTNAEMQLIRLRAQREAAAYALLNDIAFRAEGKAALDAQHAGASDAMRAFRLP